MASRRRYSQTWHTHPHCGTTGEGIGNGSGGEHRGSCECRCTLLCREATILKLCDEHNSEDTSRSVITVAGETIFHALAMASHSTMSQYLRHRDNLAWARPRADEPNTQRVGAGVIFARTTASVSKIYNIVDYRIIDVGVTLQMVIYVKCVCIYATCAIVYLAFFLWITRLYVLVVRCTCRLYATSQHTGTPKHTRDIYMSMYRWTFSACVVL